MTDDFAWLDGTAQAELVARGEVSPTQLVDAAIARIESLNPALNAVIHERFDRARAEAASPGLPAGPFRGVPFLVKDAVCHTAGDPYHCGMRLLKRLQWTEPNDTFLATRFRNAGLVSVGKTNTPELATSVTTEPIAYGPTRNPWDVTRSPGGSSGGSAAAVAAGMVPIAHGNDMGGSIRFPSSMCGLVGLKPTRARSTLGPDFGEYWGPLTHEHVLTRTVRDSAAVLDAIAGHAPGDPYSAPPPARPFAQEVGAPAGRLRIGLRTRRRDGERSHPECEWAVTDAGQLLESLGHHVQTVDFPALDETVDGPFGIVMAVAIAREIERWKARTGATITDDDFEPWNLFLAEMGASVSAMQYADAIDAMQTWSRGVAAWWSDFDLLVTPTSPELPVRLGELAPTNPDRDFVMGRMGTLTTFMIPFDVTGQPAMSVPLHWFGDSLPVGVQLVAAYAREDVLFRVAAQLEQASPWAHHRPPSQVSARDNAQ